ncbi:MAG: Ltp family lipoprotein [Anaerolineaceae bacterium]|nr:Ltp family lipoprotein [Anaerolineaceae bacterium]
MKIKPYQLKIMTVLFFVLLMNGFILTGSVRADKDEALQTAKNYLDSMPFSRTALEELLLFSGYSFEEAEYAVDNSGADWKEMAAQSAAFYLSSTDYSKNGLIRQLESAAEGYTHEEAVYGVEKAGKDVNWFEMAERRAAFYLRSNVFSENGLIRQLESESVGFTHEEAVHGVQSVSQDIDWNEMAVRRAQMFLDSGTFSENGLIHQLESPTVGFTHEQAVYAVGVVGKNVDWNEMAVRKAQDYLRIMTVSRRELIEYLESVSEGFTHDQAVYGADNAGVAWSDMIKVLTENIDNIFPIRGLEETYTYIEPIAYSDMGPETALRTVVIDGKRTVHLFANPDTVHDYVYMNRINSGYLQNFLLTMDITVEDAYPTDQAGCFIGYLNEQAAARNEEVDTQVFLVVDGSGAGFYKKTADSEHGTFTRISDQPLDVYHLMLIRFTGQTYAFINSEYAGQFNDTNTGPSQLVFGNAVYANGESAVCSFDNMLVRKVNN